MKRKPSQELAHARSPRKSINNNHNTSNSKPFRLLEILAQYGLLVAIASNIFPQDLFSLAATSKASYRTIFSSQGSRNNLLSKMRCAGLGIGIRNSYHRKSAYFYQYDCIEHIKCGASDSAIESRPCVDCRKMTCNECRIHCVYGSIEQTLDDPEDLPELSGFALLSTKEMRILTPAHMSAQERNNEIPVEHNGSALVPTPPYHDQGFLDLPLESDIYAKFQSIDAILDFDLGLGPLQLSGSSTEPRPSPVIQAFWDVSEERKRLVCSSCYPVERCHCTFRTQFLDRWRCLPCHEDREKRLLSTNTPPKVCFSCFCGLAGGIPPKEVCIWCSGAI
ncbi:hypothetical protein P280DRAFT_131599 [Massarina eburnea CBS 473.64]|uniref:Uncharacterized protein n=1 Tax=Massarina eburnea CBS 473.64 TaxID=1395130 RepID=A0A6A6SGR9_9PLEO|nr:hypothetical protein P280DRAFT_131599 [Massarina eburnea CBS 473.64]